MKKYLITILAILSLAPLAHAQLSLNSGLNAYWPLDDRDILKTQVVDRSGNNNDGVFVITPTQIGGQIGQAFDFNYSSSSAPYIDAGKAATVRPAEPFTVSMWVNYTATSTAQIALFSSGRDGSRTVHEGFDVKISASRQVTTDVGNNTVCSGSGRKSYLSNSALNSGVWYHLVLVFSSLSSMYGYINGVQDNGTMSGTMGTAMVYGTDGAWIGRVDDCGGGTPASYFASTAKIDDIRIYNRVLTTNEVLTLYKMGQSSGIASTTKQVSRRGWLSVLLNLI